MKHNIEWLKGKIIVWIDSHYTDSCWGNLVLWAIGLQTFKETFGSEGNWKGQSCSADCGGAYCGKCAKTGRLRE